MSTFCGTITGAKAHRAAGQDLCLECAIHVRQQQLQLERLATPPRPTLTPTEAAIRELVHLIATALNTPPDRKDPAA